jgi:hypothetical protein
MEWIVANCYVVHRPIICVVLSVIFGCAGCLMGYSVIDAGIDGRWWRGGLFSLLGVICFSICRWL